MAWSDPGATVIGDTPPIVYFPALHHRSENGKNMEIRNKLGPAVKAL
jgi:hypothetical protein